ncbi:MAG: alpha/beta fold hydrolase [Chitinophagales bacterium]
MFSEKKNHLLLLHGALGSKAQLQALKDSLSKDFNVHILNFEGHGGRPSNRNFRMESFAENVLEFSKEKNISKVAIFGYSMGGYVALTLAKSHPNLVHKIITLGTKFDWTPDFAAKEVQKLNPDKIEEKVPAFAQQLQAIHTPSDWKEVVTKTAEMMTDLGNGNRLTPNNFRQISTPTLISLGTLDKMVTTEESQEVARLLPNATFRAMEGFPHLIEKVDAEKLVEVIRGFM